MKRIGRLSPSRGAGLGAALAFGLALTAPRVAYAYDAEVDASVDAQFYTLRSPYGDPIVRRRRYTETLGVGVYNIQGDDWDPYGPKLQFRARLRMDADFGQEGVERNAQSDGRYIPGLDQAPLDVMYAYLEGRNYLGGWFGFRLGRQYVTDALGWWSFDGAMARVTTNAFVAAEAYGGFEQRGGLPMLASPRWEADGVYRGSRDGLDVNQYPAYLAESKLAPAYGFAIESTGVQWIHSRLSYRKVINRDPVYVSPFADTGRGFTTVGGDRVSSEKLGYAARLNAAGLGAVSGSLVYDFYNQLLSEYDGSLDWYATDRITLGADYDYYLPTFDADSIFNWFAHEGTTHIAGRASWQASRRIALAASGGVQIFRTEGDPTSYAAAVQSSATPDPGLASGALLDALGTLSGSYRWSAGSVGLRTMGETGDRGHRAGADLTTKKTFGGGFYDALAILSVYDWSDALRPTRDATSFTYVLGGGVNPFDRTRMGVEWEHSMNRLSGQRFRVLATLDFTVLR